MMGPSRPACGGSAVCRTMTSGNAATTGFGPARSNSNDPQISAVASSGSPLAYGTEIAWFTVSTPQSGLPNRCDASWGKTSKSPSRSVMTGPGLERSRKLAWPRATK